MRLTLSDHGYLQEIVFEQSVKGGLQHPDRTQKVIGRYKRKTDFLSAKAEITHGLAKDADFEFVSTESPKSLRFSSYQELLCFWMNITKLLVVYGRKTGDIKPVNYQYKLKQALETVERIFRLQIE